MSARTILLSLALSAVMSAPSSADDALCRPVGGDWTWFGDHAALSIEYYIAGPVGRTYEIGTGISFRGKPLGSKSKHEGAYMATAYGVGALHIRAADGGAPFDVCVSAGSMELIPVCGKFTLDCTF